MQRLLLMAILSLCAVLSACHSDTLSSADMFRGQPLNTIYRGGELALARGEYSNAARHFEALDVLYPYSKYAEQAQRNLIYAYYSDGDMPSAVSAADRYIKLYPQSAHIDYAYYMRGVANMSINNDLFHRYIPWDEAERDKSTLFAAYEDFRHFRHMFPHSEYLADAHRRMIFLRNLFATTELEVAEFYFQRKAYVAASNRASFIVNHYGQAPQTLDALAILANTNKHLHRPKITRNALRIMRMNYPKSKAMKALKYYQIEDEPVKII